MALAATGPPSPGGRNDADQDRLEPSPLRKLREAVKRQAPGSSTGIDRRGFDLLHWPSPVSKTKPVELSLEHEALLTPADACAAGRLITALHTNEERPSQENVLAVPQELGPWVVKRCARSPGPQSVDVFFDLDGDDFPLTRAGYTIRVRAASDTFMTWHEQNAHTLLPVNAELPAHRLNGTGLLARLEFNWLAPTALAPIGVPAGPPLPLSDPVDPLRHIEWHAGRSLQRLVPVSVHRTVRMKFVWVDGEEAAERLVANVDYLSAYLLKDERIVRWVDVDLSSLRPIVPAELTLLERFGIALADQYHLEPRPATKVQHALARRD